MRGQSWWLVIAVALSVSGGAGATSYAPDCLTEVPCGEGLVCVPVEGRNVCKMPCEDDSDCPYSGKTVAKGGPNGCGTSTGGCYDGFCDFQ